MSAELFETLKQIDPAHLTQVVRLAQRSPSFEISKWAVRRLSDQGVINPDGLWLFSGHGHDRQGTRPWSVALKKFRRAEHEPAPSDLWYARRELLFAQSDLPARLPGPVKAPHLYLAEDTPEGAWIWMEHITDHHPGAWRLDEYRFAAHQLGLWHGALMNETPLPDADWLTRQPYRSWLQWMDHDRDWQFPLNQQHISAGARKRYARLWDEREVYYSVLENLPQVFSHFDTQRRNLFIRPGGHEAEELVLVDWAQCGSGPLGAELSNLIGGSSMLLEWPPSAVAELDTAAFGSYLRGLREAGWSGNADMVRLGYAAWVAVYYGCIFPGWTAWWCAPEHRATQLVIYGIAEEELFWKLLPMLAYTLDRADEARRLMEQLGLTA